MSAWMYFELQGDVLDAGGQADHSMCGLRRCVY
jgi:hypothetical protein